MSAAKSPIALPQCGDRAAKSHARAATNRYFGTEVNISLTFDLDESWGF
jgi:hypothetical protein